ncbi:MAG: transporter substrate-binding domain-containing protein [Kiritimatiellaeota bacterium]|nr:transporter substrate-binding domain-containing protein [Kiritimatiellota bacterium]
MYPSGTIPRSGTPAAPTRRTATVLFLCCLAVFAAPKAPPEAAAEPEELRFAYAEYPPFEFTNDRGQPDGMVIELVRWIGAVQGFHPRFLAVPVQAVPTAVRSGRADVATSIFYTPEREAQYEFTRTVYKTPVSILVRQEETAVRSLADLRHRRVVIEKGDIAAEILRSRDIQAEPVATETFADALRMLANGEADAAVGMEATAAYLMNKGLVDGIKRVSKPVYAVQVRLAVRKERTDLRRRLDQGVRKARNAGVLDEIESKWLGAITTGTGRRLEQHIRYLFGVLIGVLVLVFIVWAWNVRLRNLVKQRTRELSNSELWFRTIAEYTLDWESWLGPDGHPIWVSAAVKKTTGYMPDECRNMVDYPTRLVHPDDRDRVLAALRGEAGASSTGNGGLLFSFLHKDGSVRRGEMHWRRVRAEDGKHLGVRFGVRDVTDRWVAEEQLRDSEKKYRELVKNLRDGFLVMDLDGRILEWNPEFQRLLGYSEAELARMKLSDLVTENGLAQDRRVLAEQVLPRGYSDLYERELLGRKGMRIPVEVRTHLLRNDKGGPAGYWAIVRDIRERKKYESEHRQIEERVREVQRLQSLAVLAGGVAHDFNNLLMGVLGNADLAAEDLPPDSPLRENLEEIRAAALQGADLCRQMLAYAGKGRFVIRRLSLNRLIRENQRLFKAAVPASIRVNYHLAPVLPKVEGDATQLRQMLANLLTNAVEAIGTTQGIITIRTGARECDAADLAATRIGADLEPGHYVYVEISDSGCGMDTETATGIFDPFFTTKFTGRGLGLPAVLGIVRSHHGTIEVETKLGKGSRFTVLLPAAEEDVPQTAALEEAAPNTARGGIILVVDDQDTVRTVARRMLERAGYTVLTAVDGTDGVRQFEEHADEIGCVLLDLTMPRLDGVTALRRMHRIRKDVPVILSSGYSKQEVTARFPTDNFAAFIQKPYEAPALIQLLKKVMSA